MKTSRWLTAAIAVFAVSAAFFLAVREPERSREFRAPVAELSPSLSAATLQEVGVLAEASLRDPGLKPVTEDPLLRGRFEPVSVVLRGQRVQLGGEWGEGGSWADNLHQAVSKLSQGLPQGAPGVETIEICLTHGYQEIAEAHRLPPEFELRRGLVGLELQYGAGRARYSPLAFVTQNLSFERAVNYFLRHQGQDPRATLRRPLKARTFGAHQVLVSVVGQPTAVELIRGNTPEPETLSYAAFKQMKNGLADYMVGQVDKEGSAPYLYLPSSDRTVNSREVQVRHWLATWALSDLAGARHPGAEAALARNLRYNLRHFYRTDGEVGLIEAGFGEPVGTGAMALAGLAILEGPLAAKYSDFEAALGKGLEQAFNPDGSIASYLEPRDKSGNQNFYPGEVLVYWATVYEARRDPRLLERFMKSFRFYRAWHRENRNPAFVPWHTQAYYRVWRHTKNPELKEFIFEMNDFLLEMQQGEEAEFADFRGQFWNPEKPEYGSRPHVSSTGVYLEGLTAAYRLAEAVGDEGRRQSYKGAILRGLRSLRQHQFADGADLFYVAQVNRAEGGLRTTVYDNSLRIDNGAHAMRALLEVERLFKPADFAQR